MVGLLLLPAPPLFAQSGPDIDILQRTPEERLAQIQADYGVTISTEQQTKVKNLCKTVQSILQKYFADSKSVAQSEQSIHGEILARMGSMSALFSISSIDYPEFEQITTDYSNRLDKLKSAAEVHNVLLQDAIGMDCVANPAGFKALIAAIRASRPDVEAYRVALRAFVDETAIPAIAQVAARLPEGQ